LIAYYRDNSSLSLGSEEKSAHSTYTNIFEPSVLI
jgi:hypothetical protein